MLSRNQLFYYHRSAIGLVSTKLVLFHFPILQFYTSFFKFNLFSKFRNHSSTLCRKLEITNFGSIHRSVNNKNTLAQL